MTLILFRSACFVPNVVGTLWICVAAVQFTRGACSHPIRARVLRAPWVQQGARGEDEGT